jgi:rfaE bifunctional protein nucleotidyltransferase chain/domain
MGEVISRKELDKILTNLQGKKIVFTNGVFDLLHLGHVRYLKKARQLGDVLIVGVNSDRSVRKIKGNKRPLIPEKERAEIVASLEAVDYVVIFNEETPINLIKKIKPSFQVKGGDYKKKNLPEEKVVKELGGKVVLVEMEKGKSTSSIIKKILRKYSDAQL